MKVHPAFLTVVLLAASVLFSGCGKTIEISIPKETVRSQVKHKFPQTKRRGLMTVTLIDPEMDFDGANNRINVVVDTIVRLGGILPFKGKAEVDGTLEYRPEGKAIYFSNPRVRKMNIKGLPEGKHDDVVGFIGNVIVPILSSVKVYEFDQDSALQKVASASLKGLRVTDDDLVVTIGY